MKRNAILLSATFSALVVSNFSFAKESAGEVQRPPDDYMRVTASFTPNPVLAGQSVTFTWRASKANAFCDISGVPGLSSYAASGSHTFTASENLTANVSCEADIAMGGAVANLTVNSSNPAPVVNVTYSPASIYTGQSTTLSWNSQYASNCSSSGGVSISGTAGSVGVTPGVSQTTTVTCTGPNGSSSNSASVTVSPPPPPAPTVFAYASPNYLFGPGTTWIHWSSSNATSCNYGGPSGAYFTYMTASQPVWVSCYGAGGVGSTIVWVTVAQTLNGGKAAPATSSSIAKEESAEADLSHLGIDLKKEGISHTLADLNADGAKDVLVVDANAQEAYIVLSINGAYTSVNKTVKGVGHLMEIKSVFVPANKDEAIRVSVER